MRALGGGWRVLGWLRFPPCLLKNFVYHRIARNRYAIFGRHEQCMIPTDDLRARFLEGGW